eukprot:15326295-Ditylum_brightwellii.AAC.1
MDHEDQMDVNSPDQGKILQEESEKRDIDEINEDENGSEYRDEDAIKKLKKPEKSQMMKMIMMTKKTEKANKKKKIRKQALKYIMTMKREKKIQNK